VLATITLSTALVLAPAPRWAMAEEMAVATVRVGLHGSTVDHSTEPVATTGLDAADASELRAARRDAKRLTSGARAWAVRAFGVTVDALPDGPVMVRGRVGGVWTPWFEVPFVDGESPDAPPGSTDLGVSLTSEPVWLGEADAYEVDGPPDLSSLSVHEVVVGHTQRKLVVGDVAGAAGAPGILSRASWGARAPSVTPSTTSDLKLAIVHHSVTGNAYSASQVPAMIRSIQAYHMDARGFDDIAYNFVVDRFGRIWEGRAGGVTNVVLGGHSQGFNTGTTGVVALGDYTSTGASAAMVESIARVIAWKFALHRVDPASKVPFTSAGSAKYPAGAVVMLPRVVGHRDVQATSCPGSQLYARLGTIRSRVTQLVPEYQKGLQPTVVAGDLNGDGMLDPIAYQPGSTGDVQWRATGSTLARSPLTITGTYRPVSGDFDGNGFDDILWHGSGTTADSIWWYSAAGRQTQSLTVNGSYVPLVGDFDGNGTDDLWWYATGIATDSVWYFASNRTFHSTRVTEDLITAVPVVGDFDGDGRSDVLFYGPGTADDRLWWSNGQVWSIKPLAVNNVYRPVVLDADGNGRDDLVWVTPGGTTAHGWTFSTGRTLSSTSFSTAALTGRPLAGDFDGNGQDDVLLVAPGSARDQVWYSGLTGFQARNLDVTTTYQIVTGPMDGGLGLATDDALFVSTGADYLWRGRVDQTFSSTQVG
jgi:hypothetical protein